jgi:phosphate transport system protein
MTERTFDRELKELKEKVSYLAEITRQAVDTSGQLLTEQDVSLTAEIVRLEKESDLLETELQKRASTLMALHQPVAGDLRFLLASMNIAHELERIADQCLNLIQRLEEARAFLPVKLPRRAL